MFWTVLAKTPGAQIGVRGCSGAPGAADFWYTWSGDLSLEISVGVYWCSRCFCEFYVFFSQYSFLFLEYDLILFVGYRVMVRWSYSLIV